MNMIKAVIFDLGNTLVSEDTGDAFPFAIEVLTLLKNKYKLARARVAEIHWTGVHTGEDYAGIPATGKRVEMVAVWIVDFKDGKVKVFKVFINPGMVVQQLQE